MSVLTSLVTPSSSPSPPHRSTQTMKRASSSRKQPRLRITPSTSLDSIAEETQAGEQASTNGASGISSPQSPMAPTKRTRRRSHHPHGSGSQVSWKGWNGKIGIPVGSVMQDVCGICFESAVKPNKARCCGQLFCYQHLSEWLGAQVSDGRCPTCRVPLSLERDTVALHPRSLVEHPSLTSHTEAPSARRRTVRFELYRRKSPDLSDSEILTPSVTESSSDGEVEQQLSVTTTVKPVIVRPEYESMQDLVSALVPLHSFGALLSLLGFSLLVGALLS